MIPDHIWMKLNEISVQISKLSASEGDRKTILRLIRSVIPYDIGVFTLVCHQKDGEKCFVNRVIESDFSREKASRMLDIINAQGRSDYLSWMAYEKEPCCIDEKEMLSTAIKTTNTYYSNVMKKYDVTEAYNFSICGNEMCLGIISLLRTGAATTFSEEEVRMIKVFQPHMGSMLLKSYVEEAHYFATKRQERFKTKYDFTEREMILLDHVKEGKENKEIAQILHVSENTVKRHFNSILSKTDTKNKYQLLKLMIDEKMIDEE
ncbi:helix-turn-helix transcriptional regulator [Ihubacter massiliensis]|uniref:Helix-turn-helix transcriptional regulator n=1 Tax=Hominibacterium faecale TaxID=2839743 RepID=A0A9J6QVE3_9FIRM|nr:MULTISPECIES: helix-turn-helix transcriptional regulator [Eubacteriales Family XIII. Incertae Sedis]MCC2865171.1 helix-turn-helix transcriptional regulator [Anaerovorax odorimutans]MCO7121106.1 helix-turn-helix transcriptional regulator [Ihubacter massiliensis]MCU7378022.1 helix-turn-helix transcriptional regulator [Hominibacterium faecale]MDE8732706.1 helix-turn-helix transcriptional regulator [Eubacteriales bacterium DFI.9.88]